MVNNTCATLKILNRLKCPLFIYCMFCNFQQFNDSSTIVSVLGSYVLDQTTPLHKLHTYYPELKEKKRWKTIWDFPNKYFIMYGDKSDARTEEQRK